MANVSSIAPVHRRRSCCPSAANSAQLTPSPSLSLQHMQPFAALDMEEDEVAPQQRKAGGAAKKAEAKPEAGECPACHLLLHTLCCQLHVLG